MKAGMIGNQIMHMLRAMEYFTVCAHLFIAIICYFFLFTLTQVCQEPA